MKLLNAPKLKPINKDAVIDDLKRKLTCAEFLIENYKQQAIENDKKAYEYWCELEKIKVL